MKKVDLPTYHADDGTIFTSATQAAQHDATEFFSQLLHEDDCGHARLLASKWVEIYQRLKCLHDELHLANAPTRGLNIEDQQGF